eukprot:2299522-Amphidinium_carterae.1
MADNPDAALAMMLCFVHKAMGIVCWPFSAPPRALRTMPLKLPQKPHPSPLRNVRLSRQFSLPKPQLPNQCLWLRRALHSLATGLSACPQLP